MKTNILWKSYGRQVCIRAIYLLALASLTRQGHAQCAAAPIAPAACSGGNGAATDGVNINSGNIYWVSSTSIFSSINLNGGILRICGTLIASALNFNSGTLIVENGGSLTLSGLPTLNGNTTIINRGTITIAGNITVQNSNNFIYNDLSTSMFTVGGSLIVNSSTTLIVNRGTMNLSSLNYQGAVGGFCVQDQSITSIGVLTNNTTNGFTYSGLGSPACINVSGSAALNHAVTSSSKIHVCQAGGASVTGAGGWGSAVVTTGCSSCATVLPLGIEEFTAAAQSGMVQLRWLSGLGTGDNGVYYAEKSADGVNFETIGSVAASSGESVYTFADANITAAKLYYRIRAVNTTGVALYSPVVVIETAVAGQLQLFPNPAGPNTTITIVIPSSSNTDASISLIDMSGQVLNTKAVLLTTGNTTLSWNLRNLAAGIYLVRIALPGSNLYARLAVRPN
jgi:Secretion system C-terminal sorting domain